MLNDGYTNVNEILERLRRDFGFEDVVKDEVKEWIWDAVGIIGCVEALQDKNTTIDIVNYRGLMPEDFYSLDNGAIRESDTLIALIASSDSHYLNPTVYSAGTTEDQWANEHTYYQNASTVEETSNEYGFLREVPLIKTDVQYTYKIKDHYIYCGIEETTLEISYQAFPLSEDGTPAIPNDPKYIRAIVSYIAYMIARRLKFKNEIAKDDFQWISDEYSWAIGSVKGKIKMPDLAMMEVIKNRSLRLVPVITEADSNYRYLGAQERLRNM